MEDYVVLENGNRRRHRRFPCEGSAEIVVFQAHALFRGTVRDISRSGCFIETPANLRLQKLAEVELRFTAHGLHVASLARVMEIRTGKGAGFEFLSADPRLDAAFFKTIDRLDQETQTDA